MSLENELLTVCAWCEKENVPSYRTKSGLWWKVDVPDYENLRQCYRFTHGICPTHHKEQLTDIEAMRKYDGQ